MSFFTDGYELIDKLLNTQELAIIIKEIAVVPMAAMTGGIRHADKKFSSIRALVHSGKLKSLVANYLGEEATLVRVILFDKTPENNWLVTWHQDKTICVSQHLDIPGWGPWTIKHDVQHVQPPLEVLERMVAIRIHLDDSTTENGCLRLIPQSHSQGILSNQQIQQIVRSQDPIDCVANAGSALVMRPHLLHSSSKATFDSTTNTSHRRIVHIEYSDYPLPNGLAWVQGYV